MGQKGTTKSEYFYKTLSDKIKSTGFEFLSKKSIYKGYISIKCNYNHIFPVSPSKFLLNPKCKICIIGNRLEKCTISLKKEGYSFFKSEIGGACRIKMNCNNGQKSV